MLFRGADLSGVGGFVYIVTNRPNGVLYVGFTDDLYRRVAEHKTKHYPDAFSTKYNLDKLVYFEMFETTAEAYAREQQLKAGKRVRKIKLIESMNPRWLDLYEEIVPGAEDPG
jgi:putative endonuclease